MNKKSKYLLNNVLNKKISKETKAIYRTFRFQEMDYILIPFLINTKYNFLNFNDIYISDKNTTHGSYSTIYLSLILTFISSNILSQSKFIIFYN